jgi:hypothetical protein
MNDIQKLFLFGCIPSRLLLVFIVYKYPECKLLSIILALIGFSFLFIYIFGLRKTGIEVGGGKIWWNNIRPVHGLLYLTAAYMIFSENYKNHAWKILLLDTLVGLTAEILH